MPTDRTLQIRKELKRHRSVDRPPAHHALFNLGQCYCPPSLILNKLAQLLIRARAGIFLAVDVEGGSTIDATRDAFGLLRFHLRLHPFAVEVFLESIDI